MMADSDFLTRTTLGSLVYRAYRALSRDLGRRFAEQGFPVTVEQWRVLAELAIEDKATQAELGQRLGQEKTGISRLVALLLRNGMVDRVPDPKDGRVKRVRLTNEARSLQDAFRREARQTLECAARNISPLEMETCKHVLAQVVANLEQERAKRPSSGK